MLESFKNHPHMWHGFAGAESWSEELQPLFATLEYSDGDSGILIASKSGIQVSFEDWNDLDAEAWRMDVSDQSYEFVLAFAQGLALQLKDLGERDEAGSFLSKAGFTLL